MNTRRIQEARAAIELIHGPVHKRWRPSKGGILCLPEATLSNTSDSELVQRAQRLELARIELARRDPNAFVEYAFCDRRRDPLRQAWFQEEWQEGMGQHDRLMIVAPRDSGKTTQIVARVIWELGRDPDLRVKIICASDTRARERLFEIREHLERNELVHRVFPWLAPGLIGQKTQNKITVKRSSISKDASIEAIGITSSTTGGRADIVIADDVVDQRNALAMPALRAKVKTKWFSDITQTLPPEGRVIYICTLWHKDDLSHAVMENPAYHVLRYDVGENAEAIWPEVWSQERLLSRREEIGPTEFARAFRNIPQDQSQAPIRPDWITYVEEEDVDIDKDFILWSYDLAVGQEDNHDYFAGVCFAVNKRLKRVLVMDAYHTRLSAPEQLDRIVADAKKWYGADVLVEKIAYQGSMLQFLQAQETGICVHGYTPRVNKRMRVDRTAPHLARGQVRFLDYLDPGNPRRGPKGDLVSELLDFPFGRNDDLVDAFTQGVIWIAENFLYENDGVPTIDLRFTGDGRDDEDDYEDDYEDEENYYIDENGNRKKYLF